jgi:hypothetical protein
LGTSAPDADSLVVTGTSLDCADLAASLAVQPVGLAAVEARLAVADPALFKEYQVRHLDMNIFYHCGYGYTVLTSLRSAIGEVQLLAGAAAGLQVSVLACNCC